MCIQYYARFFLLRDAFWPQRIDKSLANQMSVGQASSNCKALSPAGLFLIMEMEKEEARKKRKNLQRAKYLTVKKRREMKYRVREPVKK